MTGYQSGISQFQGADAEVLAISTDNQPTLNHWAGELKAAFPMLSDFKREVSAKYGVLMPSGVASRTTFVIDRDGKIQHIEEGAAAMDPNGAAAACNRLKKG